MATEGQAGASRRDRYAEVLVVVVVLAALLLAWGVKAGAQARSVHIEVDGFKASYDHRWIRHQSVVAPEILKISNPGSGARFLTTIEVFKLSQAGANNDVARTWNQARLSGQQFYQVLGGEAIQWRGREAWRNEFAYVYVSPDVLNPKPPVVLHGQDYIFQHGNVTWIVTCTADESVFEQAQVELGRFLASISLAGAD